MQRFRSTIATALAVALLCAAAAALASATADTGRAGPVAGTADFFGRSQPARDLPPARGGFAAAPSRVNPLSSPPAPGARGTGSGDDTGADPLAASSQSAARTPAYDLRFRGTANPAGCGGCSPPDTTGDVGPDHYVQLVNATKVAVFDKAGVRLRAPFDLGDLWPSGICTGNAGDPQVNYDGLADRWVLSQFQSPHEICFAVSKTGDPLGAYNLYAFNVPQFPDYFKVGVWPNGYYVSANESSYTAYAFDRAKMLAGNPNASFVRFAGETNFLMPADVDGTRRPAGGGLFYTFKDNSFHGGGADRIELFRLTPDFATPANSTFTRIRTLPVAPFTYTVCGFFNFDCIPQKGTATRVDAVSEWPMQRLAYRKIGARQELVGNYTVGGGNGDAGAAIRWFELRNTGGAWNLFQEGTQDPGNQHDRFMGSIAMDRDGNIALGYSVSSSTIFPGVRYATRSPGDPLGTLEAERTLQAGGGSQTGSDRWGDYSALSADPSIGCRFWYTNEFYNPSSGSNWKTVIGAFTIPGCSP